MSARPPQWVAPSVPSDPESWDLTLDVRQAERRKTERRAYVNTVLIPRLRVVGFALIAIAALLHNQFILHEFSWASWGRLTAAIAVYCAASWYALHLFYADFRPVFDLGTAFLAFDMWMYAFVIYMTGAERSWIFFLPLFRVADQTTTGFRRAMTFAHLAPISYACVVGQVTLIEGRPIPLGPELAKLLFIYSGSLYIALIARTSDATRHGTATTIRVARQLIEDLGHKTDELEASSRELQAAHDRQARLAEENERLYLTAQKERSRQLQIFESTSDGIIFISRDGKIEAANPRAGELLGFDPAAVLGVEIARIASRLYTVGDGDLFLPTLQALLANPWSSGQGDLQQPASGRVFHWVAQPARDGSGESSGLTFTIQDVTRPRDLVRQLEDKSRLLEDARLKAEDANRAKGEFLANVSHEVRTPLSAIIGMSQQMLDAGPSETLIGRIRTAAESLMVIIGDILDFSKIESRKLTLDREPFGLRATLGDTVDTLRVRAAEKGLSLELEVLPEVPDALIGDAMRLRQILLNLIGNAIKFTERGEVRLRVGVATEIPGEVCLHFAVLDTGIGIPRDKQEMVFEAFAQADGSAARRYSGTGLGLSISARLVELMGGDIWVESETGRGSKFRFTAIFGIPHEGVVETPIVAAPRTAERTGPLTVLLAEDDEVHRELMATLLLGRGHRVITANNGREALLELSRHRIGIALMDLQMPELDGLQAAATIRDWERTAGGHLPIVGMTASALADDPDRCLAAGMDRFVVKPIGRELLFRIVEEMSDDSARGEIPPELAGRAEFLSALGGDRELARKLVEIFVGQSPKLLDQIRGAIEAGDTLQLRKAAHALKGTISNFPAGPARGAAARMELIGFDGDLLAARDVFPTLEHEVERLKTLLPALI